MTDEDVSRLLAGVAVLVAVASLAWWAVSTW